MKTKSLLCPSCSGDDVVVTLKGQSVDMVIEQGRVEVITLAAEPEYGGNVGLWCRTCSMINASDGQTSYVLARLARLLLGEAVNAILYERDVAWVEPHNRPLDAAQAAAISAEGMLAAENHPTPALSA